MSSALSQSRCTRCGFPAPPGGPCAHCAEPAEPERLAPGASGLSGLGTGLDAVVRGAGHVVRSRQALRLAAVPPLLSLVIFVALVVAGFFLLGGLATQLAGASWGWFDWARPAADPGLKGAFLFLVMLLAYTTFAPVTMAVAGPFLDPVAAEVDRRVLGTSPDASAGVVRDLWDSVRIGLGMLVVSLVVGLAALPLNLIPGVGTLLYLCVMGYLTGIESLDPSLGRRKLGFRNRRAIASAHQPAVLGLGLACYGLFLIPFAGWLLGPLVAAAGGAFLALRIAGGRG